MIDITSVKIIANRIAYTSEFSKFLKQVNDKLYSQGLYFNTCEQQQIIDIAFDIWQSKKIDEPRRMRTMGEYLNDTLDLDRPKYTPDDIIGKHCRCCGKPASHYEINPTWNRKEYFCQFHTTGCKQRITRSSMERFQEIEKVKQDKSLLWHNDERLRRGIYCQKCYAEKGILKPLIKGTNICPVHGYI